MQAANETPVIQWSKGDETFSARWLSERYLAVPGKVVLADDTLTADMAYRMACEGTALLWQSDFQNARQLMQALVRRVDKNAEHKREKAAKSGKADVAYPQKFHLYRQAQAQRARILGSILIPFNADYSIPLRRAPDVLAACTEAWGEPLADGPMIVTSLREMMGVVGAYEWRKKGVERLLRPDGAHTRGDTPHDQHRQGAAAAAAVDRAPLGGARIPAAGAEAADSARPSGCLLSGTTSGPLPGLRRAR